MAEDANRNPNPPSRGATGSEIRGEIMCIGWLINDIAEEIDAQSARLRRMSEKLETLRQSITPNKQAEL